MTLTESMPGRARPRGPGPSATSSARDRVSWPSRLITMRRLGDRDDRADLAADRPRHELGRLEPALALIDVRIGLVADQGVARARPSRA